MKSFYLILAPLFLTLLLLVWTRLVSDYSRYGDYWAIIPALLIFPIAIGLHLVALIKMKWPTTVILYAIAHIVTLGILWMRCLMLISKDSL